jgi:hypothetical protein
MIGMISAVVIGGAVSAWAVYLVVRAQRTEYRQRCRQRLFKATVEVGQRMALERAATGAMCACCKGVLTALRYDAETRQNICADRELCRQTMIHENLLDQV